MTKQNGLVVAAMLIAVAATGALADNDWSWEKRDCIGGTSTYKLTSNSGANVAAVCKVYGHQGRMTYAYEDDNTGDIWVREWVIGLVPV